MTGDDVRSAVDQGDFTINEMNQPVASLGDSLVSANAYIGAEGIRHALELGADVVIAGRAADPSLFVAPLSYELGWSLDAWNEVARATHRLEQLGVNTSGIRISNQRRLANIRNDRVLAEAARLAPLMEKQTEEVNDLVKTINGERTQEAQLEIVKDYEATLKSREPKAGSPRTRPT